MTEKQLEPTALTVQDKACTNCAHYVRIWNAGSVLSVLFDHNLNQVRQCTYGRITKITDPVTGKVTTSSNPMLCYTRRNNIHGCGLDGGLWEPNDKWKKDKKNLFKILVKTGV